MGYKNHRGHMIGRILKCGLHLRYYQALPSEVTGVAKNNSNGE